MRSTVIQDRDPALAKLPADGIGGDIRYAAADRDFKPHAVGPKRQRPHAAAPTVNTVFAFAPIAAGDGERKFVALARVGAQARALFAAVVAGKTSVYQVSVSRISRDQSATNVQAIMRVPISRISVAPRPPPLPANVNVYVVSTFGGRSR